MKKKPIYIFNGINSKGIYEVPDNATVVIIDGGHGFPILLHKLSNGNLTHASTIEDFLLDQSLYKYITLNIDHTDPFEDNDMLMWSSSNGNWIHRKIDLNNILNVDTSGARDKSILMFDANDGLWKPSLTLDGGTF